MFSIRSKLITLAAIGAAAVSAAGVATAATSATSSSTAGSGSSIQHARPQHDPAKGGHMFKGKTEALLSGAKASKVRAAALAKVPGTVERVETNVDSSAPYEAHIRKADGTEVEVQVGSDFTVSAVNERGSMNGHP